VMSSPARMVDRMGLASGVGLIGSCDRMFSGSTSCLPPRQPQPIDPTDPRQSCNSCLDEALTDPAVSGIIQELSGLGCAPDIRCVVCDGQPIDPDVRASYGNGKVVLCADRISGCSDLKTLLLHELHHAWEDCQGTLDPDPDCCTCICQELRAYRSDRGCKPGGSQRQPGEDERACLRRRVGVSCEDSCIPYIFVIDLLQLCFDAMYMQADCFPTSLLPYYQ